MRVAGVQDPEDAGGYGLSILGGTTGARALRGQQPSQLRALLVGRFVSSWRKPVSILPPPCKHTLNQSVLKREAGRAGSGGDAELAEDTHEVRTDRLRAEEEALGDLGVREAVGDETENLDLTCAQSHG
jgi:hypothetical protein